MFLFSQDRIVVEIDCQQVLRELSNYMEGDLTPKLRTEIANHLAVCRQCKAVHDGMRNVIALLADDRVIIVPEGFSQRLYKRLTTGQ